MENDFEKCLEELEELLEESWSVPLARNKYIIDGEQMRGIISNLKLRMPGEMKRAKELVAKKDEMMTTAQNEAKYMLEKARKNADLINSNAKANAENLMERAKAQVEIMINQQEILRLAQERANALMEQARNDALKMRSVTISYVENALNETSRSLDNSRNALNQAIQSLHND